MSETAEIQNPVTPELALAEVPAPSLPEVPAQTPAPELSKPDGASQDEVALTAEIAQLWQIHTDYKTSLRQQSQNLHSVRAELGKKLAAMKALLATPGRAGKWSAWLKEHKIARSTADRLVAKHERSVHPDENRLIEAISEPTEQEIKSLFDKIAPKLRRVLRTPPSVYRFAELLACSFMLECWATEEGLFELLTSSSFVRENLANEPGLFLVKPSPHMAVEQSVPEEAKADPVPITADAPAEGIVESAGALIAQ